MLLGSRGLTVVVAGGPPPRRITVRSVARGAAGASLRRTAERAGLVSIDAPELAQKSLTIDAAYVDRMLSEIAKNEDLSRYIL